MPEQYERIKTFIENQNKIAMPSLSDDQFNILNRRLIEKYTTHQLAMISYFRNGTIHSIAMAHKQCNSNLQYYVTLNNKKRAGIELNSALIYHLFTCCDTFIANIYFYCSSMCDNKRNN